MIKFEFEADISKDGSVKIEFTRPLSEDERKNAYSSELGEGIRRHPAHRSGQARPDPTQLVAGGRYSSALEPRRGAASKAPWRTERRESDHTDRRQRQELGHEAASLWKAWSTYKDVGHLVAAAALICEEARVWYRHRPFGPHGLSFSQLSPFPVAMLMPDLFLAVALEFVGDRQPEPISRSAHACLSR
jgi:hypothetical protein